MGDRTLTALLTLVVVATAVLPAAVVGDAGADDATLRLTAGTASDGNVTAVLSTSAADVAGYQTNITFDPSVVRVAAIDGTDDFDRPAANVNNEAGWVFLTQSRAEGVDEPTLARITFRAADDGGGRTSLAFVEGDTLVNGPDLAEKNVSTSGATVEVSSADEIEAKTGTITATADPGTGGTDTPTARTTPENMTVPLDGDDGDSGGGLLPSGGALPLVAVGVVLVVAALGTGVVLGRRSG